MLPCRALRCEQCDVMGKMDIQCFRGWLCICMDFIFCTVQGVRYVYLKVYDLIVPLNVSQRLFVSQKEE